MDLRLAVDAGESRAGGTPPGARGNSLLRFEYGSGGSGRVDGGRDFNLVGMARRLPLVAAILFGGSRRGSARQFCGASGGLAYGASDRPGVVFGVPLLSSLHLSL